jgi:polyribonucleotide nucleotidyltransferase
VGNTGEVSIFSPVKEGLEKAVAWIQGIVALPEIGKEYEGTVKGIKEFGAFVEFLPKKEGLLHISEISWKRIDTMDGLFKDGDKVKVKLIDVDPRTGKFKLSRKALMPKPEGYQEKPPRENREGGNRDRGGDRGDRGPRGDRGYDRDRGPRQPREDRPQQQPPSIEPQGDAGDEML